VSPALTDTRPAACRHRSIVSAGDVDEYLGEQLLGAAGDHVPQSRRDGHAWPGPSQSNGAADWRGSSRSRRPRNDTRLRPSFRSPWPRKPPCGPDHHGCLIQVVGRGSVGFGLQCGRARTARSDRLAEIGGLCNCAQVLRGKETGEQVDDIGDAPGDECQGGGKGDRSALLTARSRDPATSPSDSPRQPRTNHRTPNPTPDPATSWGCQPNGTTGDDTLTTRCRRRDHEIHALRRVARRS